MWKAPGYLATIVAVAAAFGGWSLLLPVVPLAVINNGGSETLAGATTGVFMATTVITQVITPRLLRRFGYFPVMVVSATLLGLPALGYLLGMDPATVLTVSAIRGVGFGALTVAESALIAELVPMRFLGKASGTLGLAVGSSQLVFLPLGLYLADQVSFTSVYVSGAIVALIAVAMCLLIPRLKPDSPQTESTSQDPATQVATWKLVAVPAVGISVTSMGFGAVSSFLPAAVRQADPLHGALAAGVVLSIVGGAQMILRYVSGMIADRRGAPGSTMAPALLCAASGLALMSFSITHHLPVWWLFIAACLYGGGFGAVQNEALLTMFMRMPRSRVSEASALWNISFDSGTGIGSFALGMVAASLGFAGAFRTAAILVLVGLIATVLDSFAGKHRIAEHHNTRARIQQVTRVTRRARLPRRFRGPKPGAIGSVRTAVRGGRSSAGSVPESAGEAREPNASERG
ncbi:MFS transporter [Corynebacterium epidermidicanis]|nr:MFS transporter [Corynebacterium epidermidicanis]